MPLANRRLDWLSRARVGTLILAAALAGCVRPTAHPLLWRVNGDRDSYLYGTIHLPDPRVLARPPAVEAALRECDVVLTEIPLDRVTVQQAEARSRLPQGQTLDRILPAPLYERTDRFLRGKGLRLRAFNDRAVWFVSTTLPLLDHLGAFLFREPLDRQLVRAAERSGREVAALETLDEQLAVFESLSTADQVALLEATLDELERAAAAREDPVAALVEAYLRGDETELEGLLRRSAAMEHPVNQRLYDELVTRRNARFAERIAARLRASPDRGQFFALGAGHLIGANGVVARLRAAGFTITRIGAPAATAP